MSDWADREYPYHESDYVTQGGIERKPCVHCSPGLPCAEVRGTFDQFPGSDASMFIQWKGTAVCLDFRCPCGHDSHFDGFSCYFFRCVGCGARYEMGTQVKTRRMADEEQPDAQCQEDIEYT